MENYNCRFIDYPIGSHVTFYKRTINKGAEELDENEEMNKNFTKAYQNQERTVEEERHCLNVSLSATKNRIYKIARSNMWDWFITLTFDRARTDSSEYNMIVHRLTKFCNNLQQRKCPDLKYLIVPELHADKKHYHFHGLLANADNMRFAYSGKNDKSGNPIYNILDWSWGFTTATRIKDSARASSYITKYITKDTESVIKEKNRYYCSRNVERAEEITCVLDEEEFQRTYADRITYCKTVKVKQALQECHYYELED